VGAVVGGTLVAALPLVGAVVGTAVGAQAASTALPAMILETLRNSLRLTRTVRMFSSYRS
jgi:hypothetical protein